MSIFTWKRAFFGLLTFILLVLLAVFVYIANLWSAGDERHYQPAEIVEAESLFTVQTDRNRLNLLIASQLNSQEQDMPYAVELSEEVVQFRSSLRILGQHIPVTIDFFFRALPKMAIYYLGRRALPLGRYNYPLSTC